MTNTFSDSQESAIMDEETYNIIRNDFGGTLPVPEMSEIENDAPPIKQDVITIDDFTLSCTPPSKKFKTEEEIAENEYYSLPIDILTQNDETFSGQLNFQYSFGDGGTGQDWVYSDSLDKVFIKMEKILPLRFTWDPLFTGLYLRTAMVFKLEQYKSDPVKRCHNHMASTYPINQNVTSDKIKHVVHCVNHSSTTYEETNEFLSLRTPLRTPEAGSQYVSMCFRFLCKNSCPSGMNRRPTELVFTLENGTNEVLGRRKLLVRVCSCPKRDKQKEERETAPIKTKVRKHNATPLGKKMPSSDTHVYKIELNVVGKENYMAVLKCAHDGMAGQAIKTGQYEFFKPYMDAIRHKMP